MKKFILALMILGCGLQNGVVVALQRGSPSLKLETGEKTLLDALDVNPPYIMATREIVDFVKNDNNFSKNYDFNGGIDKANTNKLFSYAEQIPASDPPSLDDAKAFIMDYNILQALRDNGGTSLPKTIQKPGQNFFTMTPTDTDLADVVTKIRAAFPDRFIQAYTIGSISVDRYGTIFQKITLPTGKTGDFFQLSDGKVPPLDPTKQRVLVITGEQAKNNVQEINAIFTGNGTDDITLVIDIADGDGWLGTDGSGNTGVLMLRKGGGSVPVGPPDFIKNVKHLVVTNVDNKAVKIDRGFLYGSAQLTSLSLVLPTVTDIGSSFLEGCTELTNLDIRTFANVKSVVQNFLKYCTGLKEIVAPLQNTAINDAIRSTFSSQEFSVIEDGGRAIYSRASLSVTTNLSGLTQIVTTGGRSARDLSYVDGKLTAQQIADITTALAYLKDSKNETEVKKFTDDKMRAALAALSWTYTVDSVFTKDKVVDLVLGSLAIDTYNAIVEANTNLNLQRLDDRDFKSVIGFSGYILGTPALGTKTIGTDDVRATLLANDADGTKFAARFKEIAGNAVATVYKDVADYSDLLNRYKLILTCLPDLAEPETMLAPLVNVGKAIKDLVKPKFPKALLPMDFDPLKQLDIKILMKLKSIFDVLLQMKAYRDIKYEIEVGKPKTISDLMLDVLQIPLDYETESKAKTAIRFINMLDLIYRMINSVVKDNGFPVYHNAAGKALVNHELGHPALYSDAKATKPVEISPRGQPRAYTKDGVPLNYDSDGDIIYTDAVGQKIVNDMKGKPELYHKKGSPFSYDANGMAQYLDEDGSIAVDLYYSDGVQVSSRPDLKIKVIFTVQPADTNAAALLAAKPKGTDPLSIIGMNLIDDITKAWPNAVPQQVTAAVKLYRIVLTAIPADGKTADELMQAIGTQAYKILPVMAGSAVVPTITDPNALPIVINEYATADQANAAYASLTGIPSGYKYDVQKLNGANWDPVPQVAVAIAAPAATAVTLTNDEHLIINGSITSVLDANSGLAPKFRARYTAIQGMFGQGKVATVFVNTPTLATGQVHVADLYLAWDAVMWKYATSPTKPAAMSTIPGKLMKAAFGDVISLAGSVLSNEVSGYKAKAIALMKKMLAEIFVLQNPAAVTLTGDDLKQKADYYAFVKRYVDGINASLPNKTDKDEVEQALSTEFAKYFPKHVTLSEWMLLQNLDDNVAMFDIKETGTKNYFKYFDKAIEQSYVNNMPLSYATLADAKELVRASVAATWLLKPEPRGVQPTELYKVATADIDTKLHGLITRLESEHDAVKTRMSPVAAAPSASFNKAGFDKLSAETSAVDQKVTAEETKLANTAGVLAVVNAANKAYDDVKGLTTNDAVKAFVAQAQKASEDAGNAFTEMKVILQAASRLVDEAQSAVTAASDTNSAIPDRNSAITSAADKPAAAQAELDKLAGLATTIGSLKTQAEDAAKKATAAAVAVPGTPAAAVNQTAADLTAQFTKADADIDAVKQAKQDADALLLSLGTLKPTPEQQTAFAAGMTTATTAQTAAVKSITAAETALAAAKAANSATPKDTAKATGQLSNFNLAKNAALNSIDAINLAITNIQLATANVQKVTASSYLVRSDVLKAQFLADTNYKKAVSGAEMTAPNTTTGIDSVQEAVEALVRNYAIANELKGGLRPAIEIARQIYADWANYNFVWVTSAIPVAGTYNTVELAAKRCIDKIAESTVTLADNTKKDLGPVMKGDHDLHALGMIEKVATQGTQTLRKVYCGAVLGDAIAE